MEDDYKIAPATADELYLFQQIQSNLGWDPFALSYLTLAQICPEGLLLGKLKGQVISCCLALRYSKKYGFLAVYWVDHRHRGKRFGITIFQRAMEVMKDCEVIALDSVMQQIPNYRKWGFEVASNSTKRYTYPMPVVDTKRSCLILTDRKQIDIPTLASFDEKCFPARREGFVRSCMEIGQPFVAFDSVKKVYLGYAMVTPCESGYAIGPLMALSSQIAEDIVKEIFAFYSAKEKMNEVCMVVFTLDEKQYIAGFMKKWFPSEMYNCKRMYRYLEPGVDFDRSCVYAFSGYERG